MEKFNRSIDELVDSLTKLKANLIKYLKKNFKENIHYIKVFPKKEVLLNGKYKHGGHNYYDILLTEEAFELLKNSFNLRIKNIINIASNIKVINLVLPIENQTLNFIENTYNGIIETIRQFQINRYKVDMYFPKYKIIIECDEFDHTDRDKNYEIEREQYLISLGNTIIRFNPNEKGFDLSNVLQKINKIIINN